MPTCTANYRKFLLLLLPLLALCFAPAFTAQAVQFGPTKNLDATATDSNPNTLDLSGTEFIVSSTYTYTFSGTISGTGGLSKSGSGTLVLSNANNTYTGGTTVNGGILKILNFNSINPDSAIAVNGAGSQLISNSGLRIGMAGTGTLNIADGGEASGGDIYLGNQKGI